MHSHKQAHIVLGADLVRFICCGGILRKFSGYGLQSWSGNFSCGQEFSCFLATGLSVTAFHRNTPLGSVLRDVCLRLVLQTVIFLDVSRLKFCMPFSSSFSSLICFSLQNSGKNTNFASPIRNFFFLPLLHLLPVHHLQRGTRFQSNINYGLKSHFA